MKSLFILLFLLIISSLNANEAVNIENYLPYLMILIFILLLISISLINNRKRKKMISQVNGIMFILKRLAQDDEKVAKAMRSAS